MADVQHASLTDPLLHEVKGAAAATVSTVPVADGAGAAPFGLIPFAALGTTIKGVGTYYTWTTMADVSAAAASNFVLVPVITAATLNSVLIILHNAITVADSTLTFTNSTGPATLGTKVITFTASAEGTQFTFTPGANNSFSASTYLKILTDGASTTTCQIDMLCKWTFN